MLRAPQYYAFTADNSTFGALRVAEGALEWPGIATAPFAVARGHFGRCGTAQGTAVAAQIAEEMGDDDDAARLYRSAAALGYARASALENDAASRKTEL